MNTLVFLQSVLILFGGAPMVDFFSGLKLLDVPLTVFDGAGGANPLLGLYFPVLNLEKVQANMGAAKYVIAYNLAVSVDPNNSPTMMGLIMNDLESWSAPDLLSCLEILNS